MLGIVSEAAHRHRAPDRLGLGWDDRLNAALLKSAKDLGIGVARICRHGLHGDTGCRLDRVDLRVERAVLVGLAGGDGHVEHDAGLVIDRSVLLVSWLEPPFPAVCRHGGIRICDADLFVLPALSAEPFRLLGLRVCLTDFGDPAAGQRFPADVGANQRRVDVYDLALGDLRDKTGGDRLLEDPTQARLTPALTDTRQARVIGQTVGETETRGSLH